MKKQILLALAVVATGMMLSRCSPSQKETEVVQEEAGFDSPRIVNSEPKPGYLTPEESLKAFRLPKGYHMELVADESMLSEPVALSWDANGRMFVTQMETYMQTVDTTGEHQKGSRVLLLGLAYKPDVDDVRESPTFVLMNLLNARGAKIAYYDPHVPVIKPTREHGHWTGLKSVAWNRKVISAFDVVVISTAHHAVNYQQLAAWAVCIVDSRNAMAHVATKSGQVWKA